MRAAEGHPPPPKFGLRAKCNTPSQIHVVIFEGSSLSLMAFSKGGHTILKQWVYASGAAADTLFSDFSVRRTVGP